MKFMKFVFIYFVIWMNVFWMIFRMNENLVFFYSVEPAEPKPIVKVPARPQAGWGGRQ